MSETPRHEFGRLPPIAAGLGYMFCRPKMVAGFCVFVLAGLGWIYVALLSAPIRGTIAIDTPFLQALCPPSLDVSWSVGNFSIIVSMWGAMTLAMMLPTAAPMIMTYAGIADTAARKDEIIVSPFVLAGGYMTIWLGFAVLAALVQVTLIQARLLDTGMAPASGFFSGAVFIGAGLYQFSKFKHSCLRQCQRPFPFFFVNWATTPAGVFRLGLRQGLFCLGCCWAMMLVMFAFGVMNVIWMTGLGMIMTAEKLLVGRRFAYAIGLALWAAGGSIMLAATTGHWPALAN
jgi:predicted metal-binding membrane protein